MTKKQTLQSSYIYICQSPVLRGYKIGYHKGTPYSLYRRYQTPLTNKVFFYLFPTETPEEHEKIVHRILRPYNISNELFRIEDDDHLQYVFGYMAKMVSGCDRVKLYSRERYGYPRNKGKWIYEKAEKEEEEEYNKILGQIEQTGIITTNKNVSPNFSSPIEHSIIIIPPVLENPNPNPNIKSIDDDISMSMDKLSISEYSQVKNEAKELTEDGYPQFDDEAKELITEDGYLQFDDKAKELTEDEAKEDKYIDNPFSQWAFKGQIFQEIRKGSIRDRAFIK